MQTNDPIAEDDFNEIDRLLGEIPRTSPSGAEQIVSDIRARLAVLRMSPEERALKMPHPNAGRDPRAAGRNPPGPLTPPGVAFPVGVDVRDRSADAERAPVPVAPADPSDVQEWQDGQVGVDHSAPARPAYDAESEKKRLADEAAELKRTQEQRKENADKAPAVNAEQAERDRVAEAERKRVADQTSRGSEQ